MRYPRISFIEIIQWEDTTMKHVKALAAALAIWLGVAAAAPLGIAAEQPTGSDAQPAGSAALPAFSADSIAVDVTATCRSAILIEAETGTVLMEHNADEALPPASVTKIMTLLLVMEAIDMGSLRLTDTLTCSPNAASMGGSQVYLEPGEQMTVDELIKCVVISSANDAAVMLAEGVAGSEEAFVVKMNRRAAELGMKNTVFENTNGLDDTTTGHLTSARDIAIMSRELIKHEKILEYSGIWMDTIRGGAFGLTNTNRLIRFYPGATGLKTGSTAKAGFCMSATALRDGMHLICVVMGAETRDIRNTAAAELLDWGFANFALYRDAAASVGEVTVTGGTVGRAEARHDGFCAVVPRGSESRIERQIELESAVAAPIAAGDCVGHVKYVCGGELLGEIPVFCGADVPRITLGEIFLRILAAFIM